MPLLANALPGITLTPTLVVSLQTVQHAFLNCPLYHAAGLAHLSSSSQSHTHISTYQLPSPGPGASLYLVVRPAL